VLQAELALELVVERADARSVRARAHAGRVSSTANGECHNIARACQVSN
jgi:hypothetical protein